MIRIRHFRRRAPELGMGLVVTCVGVAGLTAHCWLRDMVQPWMNIHLLFAVLLGGWLTARILVRLKQSPDMSRSDIDDMSRQLSRIAYLVLYGVIGTKLCISVCASVWTGAVREFGPLDEHFRNGPGSILFNPNDDYQMSLAFGLMALVFVRLIVMILRSRPPGRPGVARRDDRRTQTVTLTIVPVGVAADCAAAAAAIRADA